MMLEEEVAIKDHGLDTFLLIKQVLVIGNKSCGLNSQHDYDDNKICLVKVELSSSGGIIFIIPFCCGTLS